MSRSNRRTNETEAGGSGRRRPVGPDEQTIRYYEENAETVAARYESVDLRETLERILARGELAAGDRILELGTGSGRDAAYLLARGYDVRGIDGAGEMLSRARAHHPELAGRLDLLRLPAPLPYACGSFDAVIALATLMHLDETAVAAVLEECRRVLTAAGVISMSVPARREDIDARGRDNLGRRFTVLPAERWQALLDTRGFETFDLWHAPDAAGREGIRWITILAHRVGPR